MSWMIWSNKHLQLVEDVYKANNCGFLCKTYISDFQQYALSSFEHEEWEEFKSVLEKQNKLVIEEKWHIAYNVWTKVITIAPQMGDADVLFLSELSSQYIDRKIRNSISQITPLAFEEFIVELLRHSKRYQRVSLSPKSRDGGVDFRAFTIEDGIKVRILGEIKKWAKPVPETVVDRLLGAMKREETRGGEKIRGIIIALNGVSDIALNTAKSESIEVWDLDTITRMIKHQSFGINQYSLMTIDDAYWSEFDGL